MKQKDSSFDLTLYEEWISGTAPLLGFLEPPAAQLFDGDARQVRFDVEQRRAIEHVDTVNVEGVAVAAQKLDNGERDRIRTAGGACGEDAVHHGLARRRTEEVEA